MNSTLIVAVNCVVFAACLLGLFALQKRGVSFTVRALVSLVAGMILGAALQTLFPAGDTLKRTLAWTNVVGSAYVSLLKLIVIPLVLVAITTAIMNLKDGKRLGKMAGLILGLLIFTTLISAVVGVGSARTFNLSAATLQQGQAEKSSGQALVGEQQKWSAKPVQQQLIEVIPGNIVYAMSGQGGAPTLSVVFFAALLGFAVLGLRQKQPEAARKFTDLMNTIHAIVMRLVHMILKFTPYGVLALMTRMAATSSAADISRLGLFVLASYLAILVMFLVHMAMLAGNGLNPFVYIRKSLPVLSFAFTSRSSIAALPLNIETQMDRLGVSEACANLSASFGTSIGQNGCAGVYPAMLAIMIAPTVGVPLTLGFMIKLVILVALGSFGIAGVGGGATFAALIVLSSLGLPVELVGLLIAIEPLIDMGRTALNVSGAMTAGVLSAKYLHELDVSTYHGVPAEPAEA